MPRLRLAAAVCLATVAGALSPAAALAHPGAATASSTSIGRPAARALDAVSVDRSDPEAGQTYTFSVTPARPATKVALQVQIPHGRWRTLTTQTSTPGAPGGQDGGTYTFTLTAHGFGPRVYRTVATGATGVATPSKTLTVTLWDWVRTRYVNARPDHAVIYDGPDEITKNGTSYAGWSTPDAAASQPDNPVSRTYSGARVCRAFSGTPVLQDDSGVTAAAKFVWTDAVTQQVLFSLEGVTPETMAPVRVDFTPSAVTLSAYNLTGTGSNGADPAIIDSRFLCKVNDSSEFH